MRVARRRLLASAAAAVAMPALSRLAWADTPQVTLKLHHFFSSVSSGHDKFLVPWARKVEAESGGRIRIDIFPSMQLGGAPAQLFDQARDGTVDIAWTAPSLTPGRFPKIETFELPFVPSRRALVSSKAAEDFAAAKDEFGEVYPLCFSCTDRGVLHANRPIRTVDDVKGLSLHVQTRLAGEAMRFLGARPVPMPIAQLPLAVTQHVVDGCIDPWHVVSALRLNEVLKTHTEFSDYSPSTTTLVLAMNKAAYDRLPRDLKSVIDSNSGQVAAGMAGAMWDLQAAAVSDMVVQRGDPIVTLLPEAVAHWRKAVEPVVEAWMKDMKEHKVDGGKLLASVQAALTKYAKEPEPQPAQTPPPQQDVSPRQQPSTEADAIAPPKPDVPAPRMPAPKTAPLAATPPAPQPPAAAPRVATPPAPAAHTATPAPPQPVAPAAPATPSVPAAAPVTQPLVPPPAPAPVATAAPAPIPKPTPPTPAPPKTLDIPL
jgi:TRAP-type transport system periplasmic protein